MHIDDVESEVRLDLANFIQCVKYEQNSHFKDSISGVQNKLFCRQLRQLQIGVHYAYLFQLHRVQV